MIKYKEHPLLDFNSVILAIGCPSAPDAPDGGPLAPVQRPSLKKRQVEAVAGVALSIQAS
jgi:hypothetical protein